MKAAVVTKQGTLEIQEINVPVPDDYEALVKIEVCGLCGTTDKEIIAGRQPHHPAEDYPVVLGHEAVGTVVAVGDKVKSFKLGDRVTRPAAIWPGECREGLYSAWGSFAEYGIVKDGPVLIAQGHDELRDDFQTLRQRVIPRDIDPLDGSLAIGLAEVVSWMWKLNSISGKSIAVAGTGFVGYTMCLFAKMFGAGSVILIGRRKPRLEYGLKCGADILVDTNDGDIGQAVVGATGGKGADYFIEATGADEIFNAGLGTLRNGGTLAIYGAPQGYKYSLQMKKARGEFNVMLVHAEEHVALDWVCRAIREKKINTELFRSHVWDGLESLPEALRLQEEGKVIKGFVKISDC